MRDPFVLLHEGMYYLYGSKGMISSQYPPGFDVYRCETLDGDWEGPYPAFSPGEDFWGYHGHYWAPEVHAYRGRFYMFATFSAAWRPKGTQILVADSPLGPFVPHSDGPLTPADQECLDGTLYISRDGRPFMVYCHEWCQIHDGAVCAVPLTEDLRAAAGEPFDLFHASEPAWADHTSGNYVTDGPFLHRTPDGSLLMLWSSLDHNFTNYVQAISRSDNGEIDGRWLHDPQLLFARDGGHGMLFRDKTGQLNLILHRPNNDPMERPYRIPLEETADGLRPYAGKEG